MSVAQFLKYSFPIFVATYGVQIFPLVITDIKRKGLKMNSASFGVDQITQQSPFHGSPFSSANPKQTVGNYLPGYLLGKSPQVGTQGKQTGSNYNSPSQNAMRWESRSPTKKGNRCFLCLWYSVSCGSWHLRVSKWTISKNNSFLAMNRTLNYKINNEIVDYYLTVL